MKIQKASEQSYGAGYGMTKLDKQIEKRFDVQFVSGSRENDWCRPDGEVIIKPSHIKQFLADEISKAIKEEQERIIREIEFYIDRYEYRGEISPQQGREQTVEMIKNIIRTD